MQITESQSTQSFRTRSISTFERVLNGVNLYTKCLALAKTPGHHILRDHESELKNSFKNDGIPVFICAFNESDDLPRLLLTLASSNILTRPIVVDNGSTDDTALIPKALGIECISEPKPGLVNARNASFRYWKDVMPTNDIVLGLDADCLPSPTWAYTLVSELNRMSDAGGGVFGSFWYYGGSILSDFLLSSMYIPKSIIQKTVRHSVMTHGGNFGIKADRERTIVNNLCCLNPQITVGNGYAMKDAILSGGGDVWRNNSIESITFTRSDRFPDIPAVLKLLLLRHAVVRMAYDDWYTNGRGGGVDACEGK